MEAKNIVEHLWQTEIKGIPIMPTLIKKLDQQPHYYFYSKLKKRVLRKKESNTAIQQFLEGVKKSSVFLRIQIRDYLRMQIVNSIQIYEKIDYNEIYIKMCYPFSSLYNYRQKQNKSIIRMFLRKNNLVYELCPGQKVQSKIQEEISQIIERFKKQWFRFKQFSQCQIDMILAYVNQWVIIWANTFIVGSMYDISYLIDYDFLNKQFNGQKIQNKKTNKFAQTNEIKLNHQYKNNNPNIGNLYQTNYNEFPELTKICKGCNKQIGDSKTKIIDYQDLFMLRKKLNLSILNMELIDYQVCYECYYMLDE